MSEPSVRCSRRSSSDSASFSPDLSLRKPLRPRLTPADWMARIRLGLLLRLKKGHKALLTSEALVDKQILLIVAHRVAEIDRFYLPAVAFKRVDDYPTEVLLGVGRFCYEHEQYSVVVDDSLILVALKDT